MVIHWTSDEDGTARDLEIEVYLVPDRGCYEYAVWDGDDNVSYGSAWTRVDARDMAGHAVAKHFNLVTSR